MFPRLRWRIRRAVVRVLGGVLGAVLERLLRFSSRRAGIVLVYHGVAEHPVNPDAQVVPPHPAHLLESQLEYLRKRYRIVPAAHLLDAAEHRQRGEPFPAAVTFDDDLGSHVDSALPILTRLGVHATFFLTGASLHTPFAFWWERLERAFAGVAFDLPALVGAPSWPVPSSIQDLARTVEALEPRERDAFAAELGDRLGPDPDAAGLRVSGVRALVEAGMTIGFHTLRHDRLPPLADDALEAALEEGRARLEEVSGSQLSLIAYPHGRADERVAKAARNAGYRVGFTGIEEGVGARSDPLRLGRISPACSSTGHFALQLVRGLLSVQR